MRKMIGALMVAALLSGLGTRQAFSADEGFEMVFKDGFYGGLAGALVGAAFLAFTKKPGDHLNDLAYGAGIGVLAGTTYGILKLTRSIAEIDHGKVAFHIPTPQITTRSLDGGRREVQTSVDLLKVRF